MASGFDATAFRSKLKYAGARPNLYRVVISFPSDVANVDETFRFLCRSASLPGMLESRNVTIERLPKLIWEAFACL